TSAGRYRLTRSLSGPTSMMSVPFTATAPAGYTVPASFIVTTIPFRIRRLHAGGGDSGIDGSGGLADQTKMLEGKDPVAAALVADTARPHAAERRVRKRRRHLVDPEVRDVKG